MLFSASTFGGQDIIGGKDNLGIALPTVWRSCLLAPRRMANPLYIQAGCSVGICVACPRVQLLVSNQMYHQNIKMCHIQRIGIVSLIIWPCKLIKGRLVLVENETPKSWHEAFTLYFGTSIHVYLMLNVQYQYSFHSFLIVLFPKLKLSFDSLAILETIQDLFKS